MIVCQIWKWKLQLYLGLPKAKGFLSGKKYVFLRCSLFTARENRVLSAVSKIIFFSPKLQSTLVFEKIRKKKFEANCLFRIFNAHFCGLDNQKLNKLSVVYFRVYYVKGLRFPCLDTLFNGVCGKPHILGSSTTTYVTKMI